MIKFIALGLVQGFTEFFPVSSSGHLVILERFLGFTAQEVGITVLLHLGTIAAVVVFFMKDILKLLRNMRLLFLTAVVTAITGVIAISAKDFFVAMFSSLRAVGISLLVTGCFLILTRFFINCGRKEIGLRDAVILGLAQSVAIIPGISRSGATISAMLFRGLDRDAAFMFSFVASMPAVVGATVLEAEEIKAVFMQYKAEAFVGIGVSFIAGVFALTALKALIRKAKFHYFGYYCIVMGFLTLLFIK